MGVIENALIFFFFKNHFTHDNNIIVLRVPNSFLNKRVFFVFSFHFHSNNRHLHVLISIIIYLKTLSRACRLYVTAAALVLFAVWFHREVFFYFYFFFFILYTYGYMNFLHPKRACEALPREGGR